MNTIRTLASCGILGAVAGCATLDRPLVTDFRPVTDSIFEYRAQASALEYPADSPAAEEVRMQWLRTWLDDNAMCPAGYEITDRREVKVGFGARIWYRGRCT